MNRSNSRLYLSLLIASAAMGDHAVAAGPEEAADAGQVIVTGTRMSGLKADDSAAPVQVLDGSSLLRAGQPDLAQALGQNVPAFTAQANGGDTQNLTIAAALRGLNPNDTLVLINGKRRHGTGNLSIDSGAGPYQGGAAPDWSFIPSAAIDHVEVLTDGAAAQYGTDAIAGVINIILKQKASGFDATASAGRYYAGDGETPALSANAGFAPTENSFVNVTAESRYHDFTDRGYIDPRAVDPGQLAATPSIVHYPGYPYVNRVDGDARYDLNLLAYNAGLNFDNGSSLYSFATAGWKNAKSFENYRTPDVLPTIYPNGFEPQEGLTENDFAFTVGYKGGLGPWTWDLATTYGRDSAGIDTLDSGNVSLFTNTGSTPTSAHDGNFIASQWTTNLDITRDVDVGLKEPVNVAFGGEYRRDGYQIDSGDYASTYLEGMQSFPGFTQTDAGSHTRSNQAAYIEIDAIPAPGWTVETAGRFEHYSDFGDAKVGKLTSRYDITPEIALRGTISNGFRAPTLAEEYYSATNVNINSAFVQLPPNSPGARFVGVDGLKPESSTNFSAGLVLHPIDKLSASIDAYQISITNRIAATGAVFASGFGGSSSAVAEAIAANGNVISGVNNFGIQMFANGLDTRTQGAELVLGYPTFIGDTDRIDWSLAASTNSTTVTKQNSVSPQLTAALGGQALYGPGALSDISKASPAYRAILSGHYTSDRFSLTLRESVFGPSSEYEQGDDGNFYKTTVHTAALTDAEIEYKLWSGISVAFGANNLFDVRPGSYNPALVQNYRANLDPQAVLRSPGFAPFSIDGGYYYSKLRISL